MGIDHCLELLRNFGVEITPDTAILDFGCGNGSSVKRLIDLGLKGQGCDFQFKPGMHVEFLIQNGYIHQVNTNPYRLPYPDQSFDIILSQQVIEHVQNYEETFVEIRRVLKPGGFCLHMFPSRLNPIEQHVYVPFASVFQNHLYLLIWAFLGIRKPEQKGLNPKTVAQDNYDYLTTRTNYPKYSTLSEIFKSQGFEAIYCAEELYLKTTYNSVGKLIYKLARFFPVLFFGFRTFWHRVIIVY